MIPYPGPSSLCPMDFAWLCDCAWHYDHGFWRREHFRIAWFFQWYRILSEWSPKEILLDGRRLDRIDILDLADQL